MTRIWSPAQLEQKKLRTLRFAQLLAEMQAKGYSRKKQRDTLKALKTLYRSAPNEVSQARERLWGCLYSGAEEALKERHYARKDFWEQMSCIGVGCAVLSCMMPSYFAGVTLAISSLLILYQLMRANRILVEIKKPQKGYKNRKDRKKIANARAKARAVVLRKYARLERQFDRH